MIRGFIANGSPAPNLSHQTVLYNSTISFSKNFAETFCSTIFAPFDGRIPIAVAKKDTTIVQTDIFVVCNLSDLNNIGSHGVPDLVVKIIAPHNSKYEASQNATFIKKLR